MADEGLKGKPAPDTFLEGARAAGRRAPAGGGVRGRAVRRRGRPGRATSGIVVGVDRVGQADALRAHGADVVVEDLAELLRRAETRWRSSIRAFPVEPWAVRETELAAGQAGPDANRCSRWPTATSACGRTSTRASRAGLPGTYLGGLLREPPAAVRRGGLRVSGGRPDGRQRHRRQDHPAARRRRAVRHPLRDAARARAGARPARRHACAATVEWESPTGRRVRVALDPAGLVHAAGGGGDPLRGGAARRPAPGRPAVGARRQPADARRVGGDPRAAAALEAPLVAEFADWRTTAARCSSTAPGPAACGSARRWATRSTVPRPHTEAGGGFDDLARLTVAAELAAGEPLRLAKFLAYGWSAERSMAAIQRSGGRGRWPARNAPVGTDSPPSSGPTSTTSGSGPTSSSTVTPSSSRRCASPCSTSFRPARAASSGRSRPRASPVPATTATRSGTPRRSCCRCSPTPRLAPRPTRCAGVTGRCRSPRPGRSQLGLDGAAFPWRTIHGEECSGYWPAGTAAFHINADIADAVHPLPRGARGRGVRARGPGLELLVETARLWRSLGHHDAERDSSGSTGSPVPTSTARWPTTTSTRT